MTDRRRQRPGRRAAGDGRRPGRRSTVGAVARDVDGHLAAATSTGGRTGQLPGRIGDSPIPGAGTWADDATCAVSATGVGEAFLRAAFAHEVDARLRLEGADLDAACLEALAAVTAAGGDGGCIAVSRPGPAGPAVHDGVDAPGLGRSRRPALRGRPPRARWSRSNRAKRTRRRGRGASAPAVSPYDGSVGMRTNCKFYESRTYASGDTVRKCDLDLAPEAPWRCPENCPAFKPRLADVGWSYGPLAHDAGPPRPEGLRRDGRRPARRGGEHRQRRRAGDPGRVQEAGRAPRSRRLARQASSAKRRR